MSSSDAAHAAPRGAKLAHHFDTIEKQDYAVRLGMWLYLGSFFFSSRRRHTRWTGDWSSDVCSSDLLIVFAIYYIGLIAGESLADRAFLTPFWAMWAANVILTAVGLVLLVRMGKEGATSDRKSVV